jgi:hypothetical protein
MQDTCSPASGVIQSENKMQQQVSLILSQDVLLVSPRTQTAAQQPKSHMDVGAAPRVEVPDDRIYSPRHSELPMSAKPPRPPVPTSRLGQFNISTSFGRSSPASSPPMLAPKMNSVSSSGPMDTRPQKALENRNQKLPHDQVNLRDLSVQSRNVENNEKSMIQKQYYQMRTQGPNSNRGINEVFQLDHSLLQQYPQECFPQPETGIFIPLFPENSVQSLAPESSKNLDANKDDADNSDVYVGPINPFFAGRSSPAKFGAHSISARRSLSAQPEGQISPSVSAFHQARRAIESAVDDSRQTITGTGRNSHSDSRNFVATGDHQVVQSCTYAMWNMKFVWLITCSIV